jgi:hypothetical protein
MATLWPLPLLPHIVGTPRCGPTCRGSRSAALRHCSPPFAAATGLGNIDAATPATVAARRGNLDAGHLDVEASVGAAEGDGGAEGL